MQKTIVLLLLSVCIAGSASAVTTVQDGWNGPVGGGVSQDWFNASNWDKGVAPLIQDYPTSGNYGVTVYKGTATVNNGYSLATCPVIAIGNARAVEVRVSGQAVTLAGYTTGYLQMDSGTLKTANWLSMGSSSGAGDRAGIFYMHGGTITLGGATGDGLDTAARTTGHLYVGNGATAGGWGKLFMDGGTIDAGASFTIGQGKADGEAYLSGNAMIKAATFAMRPDATNVNNPYMDISGLAQIIVNGDVRGNVASYVGSGWITADGGEGSVNYWYSSATGKTTINAPEPATMCLLGLGALSLLRRKK